MENPVIKQGADLDEIVELCKKSPGFTLLASVYTDKINEATGDPVQETFYIRQNFPIEEMPKAYILLHRQFKADADRVAAGN